MQLIKNRVVGAKLLLLASAACALLAASGAHAAVVASSNAYDGPISLRPFTEIYEDRSGAMDLQQVLAAERAEPALFRPTGDVKRGAVYSDSAWWLRVTLMNTHSTLHRVVLVAGRPELEQVDFYSGQDGIWRHHRAGARTPLWQRAEPTSYPALMLHIEPGGVVQVLARIESQSPIGFAPILYSRTDFTAAMIRATVADGVLIGGMAALAWCAFLIAVAARQRPFLWLAAVAMAAALHEAAARGYLHRLLWFMERGTGYRVELALDLIRLALLALFVYNTRRGCAIPLPGVRGYAIIAAILLTTAVLVPALPVQVITTLTFIMGATLGACMLRSAALLRRQRPSIATLIALSAVLVIIDAILTAVTPSFAAFSEMAPAVLASGTPVITILVMGANLAVLTIWAARTASGKRRRGTPLRLKLRARAVLEPDRGGRPYAAAHALQQARERDERKTLILGYIGHDMRAPLATIAGYTRLLRQEATPSQLAYIDVIDRSVGYQFSLIEELLAYTRAELEPFAITPEPTRLPELLEELARFGIALCTHNQNSFQYLPPPTLPSVVWTDAKRLRQAALNLLGNAAKFTRQGTVRLEVRVQQEPAGAHLCLDVHNDGPHIPAEDQAEVFHAFRQLRRQDAGLGLGLFIVERIVHAMGGTIELESAPGMGVRFKLRIPVALADTRHTVPVSIHHTAGVLTPLHGVEAPPLGARLALAKLARAGEISEIEQWVRETRDTHPQCEGFYREVSACIERLDLEGMQRLALIGAG
jgi:signal transduction histidine kinase